MFDPSLRQAPYPRAARALPVYNCYRLALACSFLVLYRTLDKASGDGIPSSVLSLFHESPQLLVQGYCIVALLLLAASFRFERQAHHWALVGLLLDVSWIITLSATWGSMREELNVLLCVVIAASGILTPGRFAYLYAAYASLGLLIPLFFNDTTLIHHHATAQGWVGFALFSIAFIMSHLSQYLLQKQLSLATAERLNALIIEKMPLAVCVMSETGQIKIQNKMAQRLLAKNKDLLHHLALGIKTVQASSPFFYWPIDAPATERQWQVQHLPLQPMSHHLWLLESTGRLFEEAQKIKLAALGRWTASLAHEVRNPLSSISQAAQILQAGSLDVAKEQRFLEIIHNNVARINQIIESILSISKTHPAEKQPIPLIPWIQERLEHFEHLARRPDAHIQWNDQSLSRPTTQATSPHIRFNPTHLQQILNNLIENAFRHTTQLTTPIELGLRSEPGYTQIYINNAGYIPEKQRERLFEPFFTTAVQGTGLGLFIARELALANQAELAFTTDPKANQTTFSLIIPNEEATE